MSHKSRSSSRTAQGPPVVDEQAEREAFKAKAIEEIQNHHSELCSKYKFCSKFRGEDFASEEKATEKETQIEKIRQKAAI